MAGFSAVRMRVLSQAVPECVPESPCRRSLIAYLMDADGKPAMTPRETTFRVSEGSRRFPIDELDFVTLEFEVHDERGRLVPAGSAGTVVTVYGEGEAYCVEFEAPFHALATVFRRQIGHVARD